VTGLRGQGAVPPYSLQLAGQPLIQKLTCPNDNGVVPHPTGRVNGQESPPPSGAHNHSSSMSRYIMSVTVCSAKKKVLHILSLESPQNMFTFDETHAGMRILAPSDIHFLFMILYRWNVISLLKMMYESSVWSFYK
jgi:hypothetical protein